MSEYQYYEFCSLHKPLNPEARRDMAALSSRAMVSTHSASYVYNYGDFRGQPLQLLCKHFDVFFYIANFGCLELMFKYDRQQIDPRAVGLYEYEDVFELEECGNHVVLRLRIDSEEGFGWLEGQGMLGDLLPLYDELLSGDYRVLYLAWLTAAHYGVIDMDEVEEVPTPPSGLETLTAAQQAFLAAADVSPSILKHNN